MDCSEGAGVVERQNRLGAVAVDRRLEGCGGQTDRLVPVDRLESSLAFLTDASQRGRQSIRRVDGIEIVVDLATQGAAGVGMVLASAHPDRLAILNLDLPRTRVGAVEWAGSVDDVAHGASVRDLARENE